jgi:mannose-6-phosphate isomerase-like protein (cupin superfamily)
MNGLAQHNGAGVFKSRANGFTLVANTKEETPLAIEIIDIMEVANREKKRTVVMKTRKFHAWIHYFPAPGDHDEMHCHNEDQTFYCVDGECTMHFTDGNNAVLKPQQAALITGGSFYQLENTGDGPMVLMGNRSGSQKNNMIIDYKTGKDLRAKSKATKIRRAIKRKIFRRPKRRS